MAAGHRAALGDFVRQFLSDGRFDATKVAKLLDWNQEEVAAFLDRTPSAISRNPTSSTSQDELADLISLVQRVYELHDSDMSITRAWFQMPIRALDNQSPKKLITERHLDLAENLVDEYDSHAAGKGKKRQAA
jgi:hypothetical protein